MKWGVTICTILVTLVPALTGENATTTTSSGRSLDLRDLELYLHPNQQDVPENMADKKEYLWKTYKSLRKQNISLPAEIDNAARRLLEAPTLTRRRRQDNSRMFPHKVLIPDLPSVDIGRVLELWNPAVQLNTYEKTARKQVIEFVRTKSFQYGITQMDTQTLFSTYKITRGEFIKKLVIFMRKMDLDADVMKATDLIEKLVDRSLDDNSDVREDVLDEVDAMDEARGRSLVREALAGVLEGADTDVIKAAIDIREFLRTTDFRFGLVFRGLNYALKELTTEEMLYVILRRLDEYMKTTLVTRQKRSIIKLIKFLGYRKTITLTDVNPIDMFNSLETDKMPLEVKEAYDRIMKSNAVEELMAKVESFVDILNVMRLGFSNDTNWAILLRTMTVQFMMDTNPEKELAESADLLYDYLLPNRPLKIQYKSPQIVIEIFKNMSNSRDEIDNVNMQFQTKVGFLTIIEALEKYRALLYTEFYELLQITQDPVELVVRVITLLRRRTPLKNNQGLWAASKITLEFLKASQDFEISLPSEYNIADEFAIACGMSNIQTQYKINTVSNIIKNKHNMLDVFHSMRVLKQFPVKNRVILILQRISSSNNSILSTEFKRSILPSIINVLSPDNEVSEIEVKNINEFKGICETELNMLHLVEPQYKIFKEVIDYLVENPIYVQIALREVVILSDYTYRRVMAIIFIELVAHRTGKRLPRDIEDGVKNCLQILGVEKPGDENFIDIDQTVESLIRKVTSSDGIDEKITGNMIEARTNVIELLRSKNIDLKFLLRDVRLYKYHIKKQLLIILYRLSLIKEIWTTEYMKSIKILIHNSGLTLQQISYEHIDLPEEPEYLIEEALPVNSITMEVLRARVILIEALQVGRIDRRIAYEGIQCFLRKASAKEKLTKIIQNIWPIRADVDIDLSQTIHVIRNFMEIPILNDTLHDINIYSFDFQEIFDDVIPPEAPHEVQVSKELLYRDMAINTGRYKVTLQDFVRGKKYLKNDIAMTILTPISNKSIYRREEENKFAEAATKMIEYLELNDNGNDKMVTIEYMLTGNAQEYVG